MATGPSGGGGRSVHTESSGLLSTATSSAPALAQAAASRSAAAEVCSHGIKSEAVAGGEMLRQPVFRRRIDQRLDVPGLAVDLFGGLQRVAAIDEQRGLLGQHDGHVRPIR